MEAALMAIERNGVALKVRATVRQPPHLKAPQLDILPHNSTVRQPTKTKYS